MGQIIGLIIIGAAAGFIATRLMNIRMGLPQTIALGIIGAILGGFVLRLILTAMGLAAGFIGALLGAIVLIWAWKTFADRR